MEDQLITFETAKLAKEKGFDEFCSKNFNTDGKPSSFTGYAFMKGYNRNSTIHLYDTNTEEFEYPDLLCTRPTQSLLQRWLREVHNIFIHVDMNPNNETYLFYGDRKSNKIWTYIETDTNNKGFKNYEEALEIGLQEALKLII